jgi:hypothetical protein
MSEEAKDWLKAIGIVSACGFIWLCGCWTGWQIGREATYKDSVDEAVRYGHAEYYLDEKHNKQWRWKEAK